MKRYECIALVVITTVSVSWGELNFQAQDFVDAPGFTPPPQYACPEPFPMPTQDIPHYAVWSLLGVPRDQSWLMLDADGYDNEHWWTADPSALRSTGRFELAPFTWTGSGDVFLASWQASWRQVDWDSN